MPFRSFCFVEGAPVECIDGEYMTYTWAKQLIQDTIRWFPRSTVVCPSALDSAAKGREVGTLDSPTVDVVLLPTSRSRVRRYLAQIPTLWRAVGQSDLVCVDMPSETGFLAAVICKLRSKPLVTQILGDWQAALRYGKPPGYSIWMKSRLAKAMSVVTVGCSQLVFAQGEDLYNQYRDINAGALRASMVHSTLTDEVFHLREFKEFHSPARILSVMGLLPYKRPSAVLEAIAALQSHEFPVEWWCVGDGPERSNLERAVQQRGLSGVVRFLGYRSFGPSLLSLYREADIFVHSSMTEGVPHSLLEAMANSLPVVTTSAGGIPAIVRHGADAVIVPPGNAGALAEGVLRLLKNPTLAKRLGESAYHRAKDFHSAILANQRRQLIEKAFGEQQLEYRVTATRSRSYGNKRFEERNP